MTSLHVIEPHCVPHSCLPVSLAEMAESCQGHTRLYSESNCRAIPAESVRMRRKTPKRGGSDSTGIPLYAPLGKFEEVQASLTDAFLPDPRMNCGTRRGPWAPAWRRPAYH